MHLFGPNDAVHRVHRPEVSFGVAVRALRESPEAVAETPVSRANYRSLSLMVATLHGAGTTAWHLFPLRKENAVSPSYCPPLLLAVPHVLRAAALAETFGIKPTLSGFPEELLGPYVRFTQRRLV